MKRYLPKLLPNLTLASLLCFAASAPTQAASETYILDPGHTYVLWHVNHFGFSNLSGKWMAKGTLTLDKDDPAKSKVDAIIKVGDIVTGIPELDKHLKQAMFFDVAQYPIATFISNKVTVMPDNTAKVDGILTVHGISKPIILNVKLNKNDVNPINNKMSAGFSASAMIKRSDFGIKGVLPGVADEVNIEIEAEAQKRPERA
jgi:polyisoprenoid-binding protein YceI